MNSGSEPELVSLQFQIERLHAQYAHALDADKLEEWPGFFTEKCFYMVTTADNHRDGLEAGLIWADTRGMLTDRVTALREANIYERQAFHRPRTAVSVMRESPEPMTLPPISMTDARSPDAATPRCTKPVAAPSSIEM